MGIKTLIGAVLLVLSFEGCITMCPSQDRTSELNEIGIAMLAHRSACTEEYHDGLKMAEQIADDALQKKLLRRLCYDVAATQDVRMDNCMYAKEIYNRYGLSLTGTQ